VIIVPLSISATPFGMLTSTESFAYRCVEGVNVTASR